MKASIITTTITIVIDIKMLLTEKFIPPSFISDSGTMVWLDKYGNVIRKINKDGLNLNWTEHMANDLFNMHGLDVNAELERVLIDEVAREIDNQIINDMAAQARPEPQRLNRMDRDINELIFRFNEINDSLQRVLNTLDEMSERIRNFRI